MPTFASMSAGKMINFLANFITVASVPANEEILGYAAADLAALSAEKTALQAAVNDQKAKIEAGKAATVALNLQLKNVRADIAARSRSIQGNARVSDVLKTALGLTVHAPRPVKRDPLPPEKLTVTGLAFGANQLQWQSGGNTYGVQYVIEAQQPGGDWQRVDSVTARKYSDEGRTPGMTLNYRVRARRNGLLSDPSNEATVYAKGATASEKPVLRLAA